MANPEPEDGLLILDGNGGAEEGKEHPSTDDSKDQGRLTGLEVCQAWWGVCREHRDLSPAAKKALFQSALKENGYRAAVKDRQLQSLVDLYKAAEGRNALGPNGTSRFPKRHRAFFKRTWPPGEIN